MIVDDLGFGPWQPGEHSRMEPCPTHAGALSRMDFDAALDVADACAHCRTQYRREDA